MEGHRAGIRTRPAAGSSGRRAGSSFGSTSQDHSMRFQAGTGVVASARGAKLERSTSCILWI